MAVPILPDRCYHDTHTDLILRTLTVTPKWIRWRHIGVKRDVLETTISFRRHVDLTPLPTAQ